MTAISGQRFGRLVLAEFVGKNKKHHPMWLCVCDCGQNATVSIYALRNGHTTSCGCIRGWRPTTGPEPEAVPDARWIPLSKGYWALVDAQDFEHIARHSWHAAPRHGNIYAVTQINRKKIKMHTLLCDADEIDHVNGIGTDNRRHNLRSSTRAQNQQNRRKIHGTSRFKGVCLWKRNKRWQAGIKLEGKKIVLGYYKSEEDAARAYDAAARRNFGAYARCNFPTEEDAERSGRSGFDCADTIAAQAGKGAGR